MSNGNGYSHEKVVQAADFLRSRIAKCPKIGVICGSGLGTLGDDIEGQTIFQYKDIPHFPTSTVEGHKGQLVFGKLGGKDVMCMQGRFHPYEGYDAWKIGLPIRVMKLLGIETVVITNAAGGINRSFNVGDFMIVKDHLSFPGLGGYNPLIGPNDDKFGPRFPALSNIYDKDLRALMRDTCKSLGYEKEMREGVYCNVFGPVFETVAEMKFILNIGCDAVGMSTAQEVVSAIHCGMKVAAVSLITDYCDLDYDSEEVLDHEQVLATGRRRANDMKRLITEFIKRLPL